MRETIGFAAHRLLELDVESLTGVPYGEKNFEHRAQRNGYRDRSWETPAGTVEVRIPKLLKGSYFRGCLEPWRVAEKVLTAVDAGGLCPGRLNLLGRRSGAGDGHDGGSPLSEVCGCAVGRRPHEGRSCSDRSNGLAVSVDRRPLREGAPTAAHRLARCDHRVGVNGDGRREVLGMDIGLSQAETFWTAFRLGASSW
ncbi:hypothetical protein ABID58_007416 [Bradyrhizobium sp. S3.2.6]